MKRPFQRLIMIAALAYLACSVPGSTLESNRDPEFIGQFYRMYVVITYTYVDSAKAQAFVDEIGRLLRTHGVECEAQAVPKDTTTLGLELEPTLHINVDRYTEFDPDAILLIQERLAIRRPDFGKMRLKSIEHDASVISPPSEKRVWRANVKTWDKTLDEVPTGAYEKSAAKIVERLIEDGLIDSSTDGT